MLRANVRSPLAAVEIASLCWINIRREKGVPAYSQFVANINELFQKKLGNRKGNFVNTPFLTKCLGRYTHEQNWKTIPCNQLQNALYFIVFLNKMAISQWFNHLDISHVLMAISAWYIYKGAMLIVGDPDYEIKRTSSRFPPLKT